MNPIFTNLITKMLHLKRKCPKCGKEQVLAVAQRKSPIACKFCGTKIEPRNH